MLGAREHSHPSKTDSYAGLIYELDHIAFEANQFQKCNYGSGFQQHFSIFCLRMEDFS